MKHSHSILSRLKPICIIIFSILIIYNLPAGTLKGKVLDKFNRNKKYVRVEIGGPETLTTFTNKNGQFSLKLKGGTYSVKVIERNRSMEFQVKVPKDTTIKEETFKLKW